MGVVWITMKKTDKMNKKHQTQDYLDRLIIALRALPVNAIDELKQKIRNMIGTEKTIFICGNGGSASTASHMTCDFSKTILGKEPIKNTKRLRVISLNDPIPVMTAWGNDEGYENIFSQQLENLGRRGDMLIVITGSGNSANIIAAVKTAKKIGMETIGLLGFGGGKVKGLLHSSIIVDSSDYGIVEDTHHILNHLITDYLK